VPAAEAFQSTINHQLSNGLLYRRSLANLEQNLPYRLGEWTLDRATAGALVPATAETLRNVSNIKFAFTSQAHAVPPVGQLPKERRNFDSTDRKNVVHQAFAVFFNRAATFHLFLRHPGASDVALHIQTAQGLAQ
jgi:hypothetical protein